MKKILSAVLAVAMIASMSAVAFATNPDPTAVIKYDRAFADVNLGNHEDEPTVKVDDNKVYYPVVGIKGPYGYNTDDKALYDNFDHGKLDDDGYANEYSGYYAPIEYGDTAYYALVQYVPKVIGKDYHKDFTKSAHDGKEVSDTSVFEDGGYTLVTESETVSSLKIKQEWEEGKELVKSVSVVKKKVINPKSGNPATEPANKYSGGDSDDPDYWYPNGDELGLTELGYKSGEYYYFLAIKYADSTSVNDTDVIGTLTISKSKDPSVDKLEIDITNNVDWEKSWRSGPDADEWNVTDDIDIKADKNYALKFNCDDEIEIRFDDDSTFTVDVSGQSKILFSYNTDFISKIAAKYPMAELNFWNGNGAKFNRVGEMFLSCEDLTGHQFLYQVTSDGRLAEVPGAEWDDSDEGFYFKTRVLGSYVISDMELPTVSEEKPAENNNSNSTVVVAPITNPSTGAIA